MQDAFPERGSSCTECRHRHTQAVPDRNHRVRGRCDPGIGRANAFELDDDMTVNAVRPEATREAFTGVTALGRLTDPEDVAEMVAYLASDRARNVPGQDANVDAGTVWY